MPVSLLPQAADAGDLSRALVLLLLLASACGGTDDEAPASDPGPHLIVVLGSSTAAGIGPSDPSNTWVNRYAAHLDQSFTACIENLAIGGYTTYQIQPDDFTPPAGRPAPALGHNITHALSLEPSSIVINLPSNDQAFGFTTVEQLDNYDRVAALAAAQGVALWVTTTQPRNFTDPAQLDALFEARAAIEARFGDHSIDFWTDIADATGRIRPELDSGDGIHLNDAAHATLAQRVIAKEIPTQAP